MRASPSTMSERVRQSGHARLELDPTKLDELVGLAQAAINCRLAELRIEADSDESRRLTAALRMLALLK